MRLFILITFVIGLVFIALTCHGCCHYKVRVGDAQLDMTYVLQDKSFKSFRYDPNSHQIYIEEFGSETAQVVEAAVSAALRKIP